MPLHGGVKGPCNNTNAVARLCEHLNSVEHANGVEGPCDHTNGVEGAFARGRVSTTGVNGEEGAHERRGTGTTAEKL
jgi:hypothetical protein